MKIELQFHRTHDEFGERVVAVEAVDTKTKEPVIAGSLPDMAAWLKENGFRWLAGTNGVWERAA